ncbi:MAG: hypothetical protein C0413_05375 [Clostridiales bacterium]|nr:hypothetical protein [Clostridiales bacterium]
MRSLARTRRTASCTRPTSSARCIESAKQTSKSSRNSYAGVFILMKKPGSHKAHRILHTTYVKRKVY